MGWDKIKNYGFGSRPKEQDDEYRSRIKGVKRRKRVWTDEKIAGFVDEILSIYKKILIEEDKINKDSPKKLKQETIRDMNTMVKRLYEFKQMYYPTPTKNINVNIDMTANAVIDRLKKWKKENVVVVDKKKEEEDGQR